MFYGIYYYMNAGLFSTCLPHFVFVVPKSHLPPTCDLCKKWRKHQSSDRSDHSSSVKLASINRSRRLSKAFQKLGEAVLDVRSETQNLHQSSFLELRVDTTPLHTASAESQPRVRDKEHPLIMVKMEYQVTVGDRQTSRGIWHIQLV